MAGKKTAAAARGNAAERNGNGRQQADANRRPTIIDVAERAGVSKSTVSLVLQNSTSVRGTTRSKVQKAAADIGYVYNRTAAKMRLANAGLVGLVINDLRNPFFTELAASLQMALSARGYAVVLANTDENAKAQEATVGSMIEHGVSAFVISPAYGKVRKTFDAMARASLPVMQVMRKADSRTRRFPFAAPDYVNGGKIAARHLLDQGARRIAIVGGVEGRGVTKERMAGYLEALEETGIEPLVMAGEPSRVYGRRAAARLAVEYPDCDGVLCFNDLVALGLLAGRLQLGPDAGRHIKVVGFDGIEEAESSCPPLTTVRCGVEEFGQQVAQTVLDWLENGILPPGERRQPVTLDVRESSQTGC